MDRKCARSNCIDRMDGRAPQAKFCSDACKQADYRERTDPDNQPTSWHEVPRTGTAVELHPSRWLVEVVGHGHVIVRAHGEGMARAKARWTHARRL